MATLVYAEGTITVSKTRGEVHIYVSKRYWSKLSRYAERQAKLLVVIEDD